MTEQRRMNARVSFAEISTYFFILFKLIILHKEAKQHIQELDADKRHHYAAQAVDKQIPPQQRARTDRPVGYSLQSQWYQNWDNDGVEYDRREYRTFRTSQVHDVQSLQCRYGGDEQRRDYRKVLRHVIGNGKSGQCPPRHQQLLADLHDLDQLGGIIVKIDHIPRFLGSLRTAVHSHPYICLRQCRRIIGSIAHHRHQLSTRLLLPDIVHLIFRFCFGNKIIHTSLIGNEFCCQGIVSGNHHRLYTHLAKTLKTLADTRLDDILQFYHTHYLGITTHHQRSAAIRRDHTHL